MVGFRTGDADDGAAVPERPKEQAEGDHKTGIDGGPGALEQLYRSEYVGCVRLARLLTGDAHRGEELAQDAFVRIAPMLSSTDNPAAYLRTVLVNLCRDHGRRQATVRRHPSPPAVPAAAPGIPRDVEALWQAVQALPDRRRDAVILRYWADLSTDEVARLLGVRPGTVRSLIHRGLAALQEVLTDDR